jgi:hypothetical protein
MKKVVAIALISFMAVFAMQTAAYAQGERKPVRVLRPAQPAEQPAEPQIRRVPAADVQAVRIEPDPGTAEEIEFARVGEEYRHAFFVSGGTGNGFIWDHDVLPMDLKLTMDSRISGKVYIEGYPEEAGEYEIRIRAKDVGDATAVGEYSYILNVAPHLMQ